MDRVSETQLQVGENSNIIIWRLKGLTLTAELFNWNFLLLRFDNLMEVNDFAILLIDIMFYL